MPSTLTIGVLALQGAFHEHILLLHRAVALLPQTQNLTWNIREIRTQQELEGCDALIIPGGESTTVSLVAERSGLLEGLRGVQRKPVWGTCAGLILLAEAANRTKKGGQELIGGLDVRVNRNFWGRQVESFEEGLELPFLNDVDSEGQEPFKGVFIRAPVVEKILPSVVGEQTEEAGREGTVVAPARAGAVSEWPVEVMARLLGRGKRFAAGKEGLNGLEEEAGDIVAVRQRNIFGTSFHPELTDDARIHVWWLRQVVDAVCGKEGEEK
ncbi:MAG: hypothetical protein Q9222_006203 [Ikaeria aurantiellina]